MKCSCLLSIVLAAIADARFSNAADTNESLPVVAPKVKSLAAFKNGLAFVFKTGETPLKDGWARMDQLPPAALGTLWIGTTSKSGPVTDVVAYKEKAAVEGDSLDMGDLLAGNTGRHVSITYLAGATAKTAEGVLLSVPRPRKPDEDEIASLAQPDYRYGWPPRLEPPNSQIVLLLGRPAGGGDSAIIALNLNTIQSVEFPGDASLRTKVEREMARTRIHVGGNPAQAEITVACLEKGIVWSPSYRIDLADEKNAAIELEAVLADDQEDLENADVSFVVGYPNFLFADVLSPMALQQSVAAFLQNLLSNGEQSGRSRFANNIMGQQNIAYNAPDASGATGAGYSVAATTPGGQNEDLYLYRKSGVTLKKGDRARFNILSVTAPYEHLYQWEVSETMNMDEFGRRNPERAKPEDLVWHVLRIKNTGQQPWTTAPAFAVSDRLPVAQDTLSYTPPGGLSTLKLTVASDVRAEQSENESARSRVTISGRNYDEITLEGKLRLTNWKDKEIAMSVRKSLLGEVLESPDGKVSKVAQNLTAINPNSQIEWEFKLPAGQTRELTYRYKVLLTR